MTFSERQVHWKQYEMVEATWQVWKRWLKNFHVMSKVKFFAIEDVRLAGEPDGPTQVNTQFHVSLTRIIKGMKQSRHDHSKYYNESKFSQFPKIASV